MVAVREMAFGDLGRGQGGALALSCQVYTDNIDALKTAAPGKELLSCVPHVTSITIAPGET